MTVQQPRLQPHPTAPRRPPAPACRRAPPRSRAGRISSGCMGPNSRCSACPRPSRRRRAARTSCPRASPTACSACATSVLPVPVSPSISTWPSAWPRSRMSSRSRSIAGELPISFFISWPPSDSSRRSARLSSVRRRALRRLLGQFGHPVGVERLLEEVEGADPHRLHRHRHVAMAGDHDHGQRAVDAHQLLAGTASRPSPAS